MKFILMTIDQNDLLLHNKNNQNENSNALYDFKQFTAFFSDSVQSKKPSGGPKGLIGPPCHGALAAGGKNL
jgi:hypothetical protein